MEFRSFVVGAVAGGFTVVLLGAGGLVAYRWATDPIVEVTESEVQLSGLRTFVESHAIPLASDLEIAVEFGGGSCGGVVAIRLGEGEEEVFIVRQDSGDPFGEPTDLSLEAARDEMSRDERCF